MLPPLAAVHRRPVQLIDFFFEFLSREALTQPGLLLINGSSTYLLANLGETQQGVLERYRPATPSRRRQAVLTPATPFAAAGPEGARVVLDPLGFATCEMALFAVNDNPDVAAAGGGSHWSLLAYTAADRTFRHYDSLSGSNQGAARRVYDVARTPGSRLVEARAPQQANGYDCGVHVLALARLLGGRHAQRAQLLDLEVADAELSPAAVTALRREVMELIQERAAAAAAAEAAAAAAVAAAAEAAAAAAFADPAAPAAEPMEPAPTEPTLKRQRPRAARISSSPDNSD